MDKYVRKARRRWVPALMLVGLFGMEGVLLASAGAAPIFDITFLPGTSAEVQARIVEAANRWSQAFTDNVTIKLTAGFQDFGSPNGLGFANSSTTVTTYGDIRTRLSADATSTADATALSNLPVGTVPIYINRTSDNPNGSGSATPYLHNNGSAINSTIILTNANAKALGLAVDPAATQIDCIGPCDGSILFNTQAIPKFDFDPSDGIAAGLFDFTGLVAHEIGHVLGFYSEVDTLDFFSLPVNGGPFPADDFIVNTLDLYRCSLDSRAAGASIDFTADTRTKSFSLDNCATTLANFSTGKNFGGEAEASHWESEFFHGTRLGVMDPFVPFGPGVMAISELDLIAFDVIGWDRVGAAAVPQPASLALLGLGLAGLGWSRRRK